jgi:hypothetical protein
MMRRGRWSIGPGLANDPTGQRASLFVPASHPSAWLIDDTSLNRLAAGIRFGCTEGRRGVVS